MHAGMQIWIWNWIMATDNKSLMESILGYACPGLTVQSSYKENPAICQDCPVKSVYSGIVCVQ